MAVIVAIAAVGTGVYMGLNRSELTPALPPATTMASTTMAATTMASTMTASTTAPTFASSEISGEF